MLQAAAGMMYLHSRKPPIVHRDVKSDNFLITADWNLKVRLLPLHAPSSSFLLLFHSSS
jgi:serine/threonine protein kinase